MMAAQSVKGSHLHFSGDLTWWMALLIAIGAVVFAAWIYRGDLQGRTAKGLWLLPVLGGGGAVGRDDVGWTRHSTPYFHWNDRSSTDVC